MPPLKIHFIPWQTLAAFGYVSVPLLLITLSSNKAILGCARLALALFLSLYLLSMWVQIASFSYLGHLVDLRYLSANWIAITSAIPSHTVPLLLCFTVLTTVAIQASLFLQPAIIRHLRFRVGALSVLLLAGILAFGVAPQRAERIAWDPVLAFLGIGSPINFEKDSLALNEDELRSQSNWVPQPITQDMPNIILFMADSVNVKHLSAFGYPRQTTPFLDNLDQHYPNVALQTGRATCPDSICAVMSMLQSRRFTDMPTRHHFGLGRVLANLGYDVRFVLVSDHRAHFYNPYVRMMDSEAGDIFDYTDTDTPLNSDTLALEGLSALPDTPEKPTFIFAFFFSAHLAGESLPAFAQFGDYLPDRTYWSRKNGIFSADDLSAINNHYDNRLLQLDHFMTEAWNTLERKKYTQNSVFLFLADHGEALGAQGQIGHSMFTEETLGIPFVAAATDARINLDWTNPEQIDIAPTLLSILGQKPPENWQGTDLTGGQKHPHAYHETGMRKFHSGENCIGVFMPQGQSDGDLRIEACLEDAGTVDYIVSDILDDRTEVSRDWTQMTAAQQDTIRALLARGFPNSEVVRQFDKNSGTADNL